MSSSSVSFRIGRHTQDLAETVHALSQRLVTMEQRLEALELQLQVLRQQPRQTEQEEADNLAPVEAHIERLLQDCRQLLAEPPSGFDAAASLFASAESEAMQPDPEVGDAALDPHGDVLEGVHAA